MAAALADPETAPHVALVGDLFPQRRGKQVKVPHLTRALAARDPHTGKMLRSRVNTGTRQEGERRVSNVCYGFDVPLAVDKSVTVAALLLGDKRVMKTTLSAMRRAARWLSRKMDRRLRKGGANRTVATGQSAVFFLPEKAGRDGQPHLHGHLIIPNITRFEDDGRTRYCAAHFQRIAKLAMVAQRRMNRTMYRSLVKAGYAVELSRGVCRVPAVSKALCDKYSPAMARIEGKVGGRKQVRRGATRRVARMREDAYLRVRPAKKLQTLAEWRTGWEQEVTPEKLKVYQTAYDSTVMRSSGSAPAEVDVVTVPTAPPGQAVPPPVNPPVPRIKGGAVVDRDDDVAVAALRQVVESYESVVSRKIKRKEAAETIEVIYTCPESTPRLVDFTELIRSALRRIFGRIIIHQRFSTDTRPSILAVGATALDPQVASLLQEVGSALQRTIEQTGLPADVTPINSWLLREPATKGKAVTAKSLKAAIPSAKPVSTSRKSAEISPVVQQETSLPAPIPADRSELDQVSQPLPKLPESPEMEMLP